jgi:hypothetical protein
LQRKRSAWACRTAIALGGSFRGRDSIASPGVRRSGTTNGTGVECMDSFGLRQVEENGLQALPGKPVLQLALVDGPPLCVAQWGIQGVLDGCSVFFLLSSSCSSPLFGGGVYSPERGIPHLGESPV